MKLSDLIAQAQALLVEEGDLVVAIDTDEGWVLHPNLPMGTATVLLSDDTNQTNNGTMRICVITANQQAERDEMIEGDE